MTQVVIIGAGPTGLTLGLLLAQRGIAVKVVEASRSFRRIFRGEALMPSGLAAIEQMGLADVVAAIPHRSLDAWEFYIEKRRIFRVDEPMVVGEKPCTLISQPAFLAAVVDRACEYANFELIQGTALQDLVWDNHRVAGVKLSDGQTIRADLVIGADGRNSIVRQRADLALNQAEQDFDILWFKLPSLPPFGTDNVFTSMLCDRDAFGVFEGSEGQLQIGWSLHKKPKSEVSDQDDGTEWQKVDWVETIANASPDWLANHLRQHRESFDRPLLLSIIVGRCPQWYKPGVLLLGDAVHPMSPIRAQGINMALRDVIVAVNHLGPVCRQLPDGTAIDAALPLIQTEREPEIIQIQKLQQAEIGQARLLRDQPLLRQAVSRLAPIVGGRIRHSWLARQRQLRQGFTAVSLTDAKH
jgi:2-polyprenyl-6-methoxyphenol hydroxylase-like FAD-dependent oxidoreductase